MTVPVKCPQSVLSTTKVMTTDQHRGVKWQQRLVNFLCWPQLLCNLEWLTALRCHRYNQIFYFPFRQWGFYDTFAFDTLRNGQQDKMESCEQSWVQMEHGEKRNPRRNERVLARNPPSIVVHNTWSLSIHFGQIISGRGVPVSAAPELLYHFCSTNRNPNFVISQLRRISRSRSQTCAILYSFVQNILSTNVEWDEQPTCSVMEYKYISI